MCDDENTLQELIADLKAFKVDVTYSYDPETKCVSLGGWHHGPFGGYFEACLYLKGLYNGLAIAFATKAPLSAASTGS